MGKIGVIGDAQSVLGFKAFGLDVFACQVVEDAAHTLHKIAEEGYGIIYITERFYKDMGEDIAKYFDMRVPAIIPIPGVDGSFGIGIANVKKSVERAVGADILFGGDNT
ncbi:V-type ATP synthase subunit F [Hominifimenecus sp. rT4P-3]|uniref:V-type ATP synthase subunit F n=1 Tax=Hominifimenecus sp. rT4P-3 TaxID=3242979 RepID=UPI003DA441B1